MILTVNSSLVLASTLIALAEIPKETPSVANLLQAPPAVAQALFSTQGAEARAVMGVVVGPVEAILRAHLGLEADQGIVLMSVSPGLPADRAGLRQYDVLLSIDDHPVGSREDLQKILGSTSPGEIVLVTARRGNEVLRFEVTLAAPSPGSEPAVSALTEMVAKQALDEAKKQQKLAELNALGQVRSSQAAELQQRELELAERQAQLANDRDRLTAELEAMKQSLGQLGYVGSRAALEEGAAKLQVLKDLLVARGQESDAAARAARDHLASLQEALADKVERFDDARALLADHAEALRAKIEAELRARAESLENRVGTAEAEAMRKEATRIAEVAKQELLAAREHLFGERGGSRALLDRILVESDRAEQQGNLARAEELRAEAHARQQLLEELEAERMKARAGGDEIQGRLTSIEERLMRIEEMLAKLVKRDSQN